MAAAVAAALLAAPPAHADELSREELGDLAARAAVDEEARARLLSADSVEGQPVDFRLALAGARAAEAEERLRMLAEAARAVLPTAPDAEAARREAREIVSERRFRGTDVPRPFGGVLDRIGDILRSLAEGVAGSVPVGPFALWAILAGAVVLGAVLVTLRLAGGRSAAAQAAARPRRPGEQLDPRELEREADAAERRGELERALRLRFRAGLLRLDELRAIEFRESLTSGEVARRLRSREFDRLARLFDEVVYGRRPPRPELVALSREGWRRVLAEASRA